MSSIEDDYMKNVKILIVHLCQSSNKQAHQNRHTRINRFFETRTDFIKLVPTYDDIAEEQSLSKLVTI